MIQLGDYNTLKAKRSTLHGWYLVDTEDNEVLLPKKYIPEDFSENDLLEVFVYKDSEDRIVACCDEPYAIVGDFAYLYVKDVNKVGAFLDWGLEKDLFVPYSEQQSRMEADECYVVHVSVDEQTGRIIASSKLNSAFEPLDEEYKEGEEVEILVYRESNIGYEAVIDDHAKGLIYKNEIHQELNIGDRITGFIKTIREDGKVDLRLQKTGGQHIHSSGKSILELLKEKDGVIHIGDKSTPEEIKDMVGLSKKAFKKAIGGLYKKKLIKLSDNKIELLKNR